MTSTSIPTAVLQAKRALHFEINFESSENKLSDSSNCEIEDVQSDGTKSSAKTGTLNVKPNPVQLVREILNTQETLSKHNREKDTVKEQWAYPLGDPEVISRVVNATNRLASVIDEKDQILETLRNPIAENSIPWRKDCQRDLVDSFTHLKSISQNKLANTSNISWIENQDWEMLTNKDLPAVETKILRLEAEIASELKECKVIKSLAE